MVFLMLSLLILLLVSLLILLLLKLFLLDMLLLFLHLFVGHRANETELGYRPFLRTTLVLLDFVYKLKVWQKGRIQFFF